jgi:chloride channel 7
MIHSGAVVAAGILQGKSVSLAILWTDIFKYFRNDVEKRDFVAAGAAAGVAAAFGAPIGGVLFSLEEGSSFWNQSMTWRSFFCSMTSTFVLNLLLSGLRGGVWGQLSNPGLINFGKFEDLIYSFQEVPWFIIIGIFGGLLGALFIHMNIILSRFRSQYIGRNKIMRILESMIVAAITTSVGFALLILFDDCLPLEDEPESNPLQFLCPDHQYSAMAALVFNTPEAAIKSLFHASSIAFSKGMLAAFCACVYLLACFTYGLSIPSGLFVPGILVGAAFGRLFALIIQSTSHNVPPGNYALIGAAAVLGGMTRMTISLTVIVIEATGNVTFGLPIMLAVIFAKWIGDSFNEGIYDEHIELKGVPLLKWDPPRVSRWSLTAQDIMSRDLTCITFVNKVVDIYNMLTHSRHGAFPVVNFCHDTHTATFCGFILRTQLIMLLKCKVFNERENDHSARLLTPQDFREAYPRWPTIDTIRLTSAEKEMWLDVRHYMNPSPLVLYEVSKLNRIFRLFRTMGLRHLGIINYNNQIVGVVTRKDLSHILENEHFRGPANLLPTRYRLPESFSAMPPSP